MNNSPSIRIWNRFKRNKFAMGGLVFIVLMMAMGILGYLIIPDQTPYSSTYYLALNKKKPGRTFDFLIISRNNKVKKVNFLEKMLFGQEANFRSIPVTSIWDRGKFLVAMEYVGDDEKPKPVEFLIGDICPECVIPSKTETPFQILQRENVYRQTY